THVNFEAAESISKFYQNWFNPYLNYHRPCLYVTEIRTDQKGRQTKIYGQATTPYEKLKEVSAQLKENFLKPNLDFTRLDKFAYQYSDNQFAYKMRMKEKQLFDKIDLMKG
ncbi:MAG: integrase, partial [Patescibacteria group bacterium]